MGKALLAVIAIALFVYAVFDLVATPAERIRLLPKAIWFVVLLLVPLGPLGWLAYGHVRQAGPPRQPGSGGWSPPRPRGPRGPDDDPDYLRGL